MNERRDEELAAERAMRELIDNRRRLNMPESIPHVIGYMVGTFPLEVDPKVSFSREAYVVAAFVAARGDREAFAVNAMASGMSRRKAARLFKVMKDTFKRLEELYDKPRRNP